MRRDFAPPGTRPRYAPDRVFDVRHIKIALDLDVAARSVRGTCSLTLAPLSRRLGWISLDAVELDIERVSIAGRELRFRHDGMVLRIDLTGQAGGPGGQAGPAVQAPPDAGVSATDADEFLVVDIVYSGSPRRGLYFVGPDDAYPDKPVQIWSQGQDEDSRFWFPCFDSPHEKATSEVVATVPARFYALSNGVLVADTTDGDRRTMHWRLDTPHSCYLITLVAAEFSVLHDRWRDVEVAYYVAPGREQDARRTLGKTPEMLDLFSRAFGVPYPYGKYAQVFVADFIFGGMENTTATTLTDAALVDERAAIDYDVESLVAHELAHQWFGDLLTCRDWGEGWLNEGFATYAEYLWREHANGRDAADVDRAEWATRYFDEDSQRYRRTIATKLYDEPIDIFDHHLYEKAGCVLHMMRFILGEQGFGRSIAHYLSTHRLGSVETRDLARAVEAATGRVLDWFFDQWITQGAGHPELAVSYAWDDELGLARLTVEQRQELTHNTPLFRLPLMIRFRVGDRDRDLDISITETTQTFYFALESEPSQAIFDPGKVLLGKVQTDKSIQLWIAELAGATHAIDRIHAARELARRADRRATEALTTALTRDPFWAVRAAAATALGDIGGARSRDALIAAVQGEDISPRHEPYPKTRRAVVRALGSFRDDEAASDALAGVVIGGDASYFVEAEACLALGKCRSPRAPELLRQAALRNSHADVIRQYAYRGLAETRDDTAIPFLQQACAYGRVSQGRRAALKALAELVRGRRDRHARDVRDLAERLLFDPDFRVQLTAVETLGAIADPAAIPALQKLADRGLDGRLRRRANEAIRDIRDGLSQGESMSSLRDEVAELRRTNADLRERLEALEALAGVRTPPSKKPGKRGKQRKKDKKG